MRLREWFACNRSLLRPLCLRGKEIGKEKKEREKEKKSQIWDNGIRSV